MRSKLIFSAASAALLAAFGLMGSASAQTAAAGGDQADNSSTTARFTGDGTMSGTISPAGDKDWYRLSVRRGQIYRIALNGADGGLSDPTLRVVSADGSELASNDDGPNAGLNSYIEYVPARSGDVYLEAAGFNDTTGAYTLHVESGPMPPDPASSDTHTGARITLGTPITAGLDYSGDKDWYRLRLEQGHSYRFALSGAGEHGLADPKLAVHNAAGEEIASDDDGGEGLNSYLEFIAPTTGDYFLAAEGFGADATGQYTLSAAAGDTPGDATTDVTLSADGDARDGVLAPAGDSDWFRVTLAAGQSMRVSLNGADGGLGDPLLVLHGPNGAEITRDDDGGPGLNSRLEFIAPTAGTYFVEARGFGDDAQGKYTIQLDAGEIPGVADGAETLEANGEGRDSIIAPAGDKDWFSVELVEGRPYRFGVESADTEGLADPMLTLFDDKGKEVASDDDGGAGANAYLNFVSPTGGTYYAQVSSFDAAGTGHYHLHVSDTDVPGNINTDETLAADDGDDRTSMIEMPGDLDAYKVTLKAGVHYIVTVAGAGDRPLADPFLTILNDEGTSITTDDDSGPGSDARLDFVPQKDGDFFLQASGNGGSTGGYKISVARRGS